MKKILLIFILLLSFSFSQAEEFIPVESPIYNYLFKLEAEGYISSAQLSTLPISKSEVKRLLKEAEDNANEDKNPLKFIAKIKNELGEKELKASIKFDYSYTENNSFLYDRNKHGIETKENHNLKLELPFSYSYKNFGISGSPYFLSNESYENINFRELYSILTYKKGELTLGKQTQWWGGGRRGSILLSDNAESLNVLKISNSTPYQLFIPFRLIFFLTKLENNRNDVQSPYLQGVRLTFKPSKYFELGLSKTGIYGGRGRDNGVGAFVDSLIGNKEKNTTGNINKEPGDQRAGFDLKLISPNKLQPFVIYFEAVGEDVSHDFPYPYKFAYLTNLYLPRVLNIYNLELLAEYAQTTYKQRGLWYKHHIFTQGYTYNGDIIGHYIGSDAKDFYLKATYNLDNSRLDISYERYRRYVPNFVWESYILSFHHDLTRNFSYSLESGINNEEKNKLLISVGLQYKF